MSEWAQGVAGSGWRAWALISPVTYLAVASGLSFGLSQGRPEGPKDPRGNAAGPSDLVESLFSLRSIAIFSTVRVWLVHGGAGRLPAGTGSGPRAWGWPWFVISLILMIVGPRRLFLLGAPAHPSPRACSAGSTAGIISATIRPIHRLQLRLLRGGGDGQPSCRSGSSSSRRLGRSTGLFIFHQIARNTLGHTGYEIMPARATAGRLFDWITSVTHHDLHHDRGR